VGAYWKWVAVLGAGVLGTTVLGACSGSGPGAADGGDPVAVAEQQALTGTKAYMVKNLTDLHTAASALCADAPAPAAAGWNATTQPAALSAMKADWKRARTAYEHIEGAIAVLFPELDVSTDQRYDAFLADSPAGDDNLFDDQTVTGIHALERILWSDAIPSSVVAFESKLPHYKAATFPASAQEASDFKDKLCARLVADVQTMTDQFSPLALDPAAAYRGVIGSMKEQLEKAEKATTGEEESRYAQYTLADMRTNVAAGLETFTEFKPWLLAKGGQAQVDAIAAGFGRVNAAYAALPGDALPAVPSTWSNTHPTAADLQTDFGKLWAVLHAEADPDTAGTLVSDMDASASTLGIAQVGQ
jgi:iron uptake system component EfeO